MCVCVRVSITISLATSFTHSSGPPPSHYHQHSQGETLTTLKKLISELASIFPDEFIHLGCDETREVGLCTVECKSMMLLCCGCGHAKTFYMCIACTVLSPSFNLPFKLHFISYLTSPSPPLPSSLCSYSGTGD